MITRRTFINGLAAATAAAGFSSHAQNAKASEGTVRRSEQANVRVDTLCYDSNVTSETIGHAIEAGLTSVVFDINIYPREYTNAVRELSRWNELFRIRDRRLLSVRVAADFDRARREQKLGIVLACQDASILGTSLGDWKTNLTLFYVLGLRVLQLTHNARTHWADSFMEKHDGGVSRGGEELIGEMNRLGMITDLSHCSRQTLLDAVQLSKQPCIVTHSGCKALAATARNKSDEEILAIGKSGGFFGVYNMATWLTPKPTANVNTVIDHIDHAVQLIGADKIGFGSDGALDKIDASPELARMANVQRQNAGGPSFEWEVKQVRVPELNSPRRLTALADGLSKRGFSDEQIDGITGGDFVRLFQAVSG